MKTIFLLLFALCCSILHAQVTGQVRDAAGQPVVGATVLLYQAADTLLVKGVIADAGGQFRFENVAPGNYQVAASMLGFADFRSPAFTLVDGATKDLGPLTLREDATQLQGAEIVARRPFLEQKVDRTVVNVANSITNAGGTALEVLQRAPGVQVNRQTKTIGLAGKQGVAIMINGKLSRIPEDAVLQLLDGMNAGNIDRIELIHTPPANFEAEGNAGIINIILKNTGEEGLNGGYSVNAGYGKREKYGAGLNFNYRKAKLNWFGNYDYNFDINPQVFTNYRGVRQNGNFLETDTYSNRPYTPTSVQNARLGLDWQLSKKTVVGVLGTFFHRDWYMEAVNNTTYSTNGVVTSRLRMPNTETNVYTSFSGNVNLAHTFSPGQSLTLDADYIAFDIHNPSHYQNQYLDAEGQVTSENELRIAKETPIRIGVGKVDYTRDFGKNVHFETGAKLSIMRFDNDVRVESHEPQQEWLVMPEFTSLFHLTEDIVGAYTALNVKLNAKTDFKAGLRYEYTQTNLGSAAEPNVVDRRYGSWFPSIFLSRKLSENQQLNLSYSRRIRRPQFSWLAPWLIFSDPTTLQGGNPGLQPSFTDAVSVSYGRKGWLLSLQYSIEHQPMSFVPRVDAENDRQVISFENLGEFRIGGLDLFFPLRPAKWWEMQNNVAFNYQETSFELQGEQFRLHGLLYWFNSTHTIKLPRKFTLEVSGNYNSPGYWGVARWEAVGSLNAGLQKDLGARWGKLRFNVTDIFQSQNWYGLTEQPEINLLVKSSFRQAERTFMLTYTNTFGNSKLKSARQRQTGAAEEMRRL